MIAAECLLALAERFCPPQYAFLPQVRDSTGMGAKRTADAVAMSLWPSRGLELLGFEVKVSRMDWLRELRDPAKADEFVTYCDRWYVVIPDRKIVQNGELPPTWGLMIPRGRQIIVEVEAPKLVDPAPLDRRFFAALLRRAAAVNPNEVAIQAAIKRTQEAERKYQQQEIARQTASAKGESKQFRQAIQDFEARSGVRISEWDGGNIGAAVKLVTEGKLGDARRESENIARIAKRLLSDVQGVLDGTSPAIQQGKERA